MRCGLTDEIEIVQQRGAALVQSFLSLDESEFESGNITDDSPENKPQDGFDDGIVSREDAVFAVAYNYRMNDTEDIDPVAYFNFDKSGVREPLKNPIDRVRISA